MIRRSRNGERWEVYGKRAGKTVYVGSYDSKREAESAERRHVVTQEQIAAGELPPEVDLKRTVRQATEEWLKSLKANKSRSAKGYEDRLRIYIWPMLGAVPIAIMTKPRMMEARDEWSRRFSAATTNGNLTCLSSAFRDFVDRGWVPVNPCRGVKRIKSDGRVYNWISSREDITRLLGECPRGIRELAAWAVGCGLRIDELLHLRWADVDLDRRLIAVHRGRQGTTKSGRVRHIPILDTLLPLVRSMRLNRDGAELVFPGKKGKPRSKPGVRVPFKQAVVRAGVDPKLRFHDLRHTFASHWVLDGGDIFRLSKILGHANVIITQKTYAHLAPEAWTQDYHRVAFVLPADDAEYGVTKNPIRLRSV